MKAPHPGDAGGGGHRQVCLGPAERISQNVGGWGLLCLGRGNGREDSLVKVENGRKNKMDSDV